jgi:hypothetical protein
MSKIIIGLLAGLVIGGCLGFLISDVTAYSKVDALRREAFTGGLISMCVSIQDENDLQLFTVDQCDGIVQQSIANNYFEQWDAVPTATPQE